MRIKRYNCSNHFSNVFICQQMANRRQRVLCLEWTFDFPMSHIQQTKGAKRDPRLFPPPHRVSGGERRLGRTAYIPNGFHKLHVHSPIGGRYIHMWVASPVHSNDFPMRVAMKKHILCFFFLKSTWSSSFSLFAFPRLLCKGAKVATAFFPRYPKKTSSVLSKHSQAEGAIFIFQIRSFFVKYKKVREREKRKLLCVHLEEVLLYTQELQSSIKGVIFCFATFFVGAALCGVLVAVAICNQAGNFLPPKAIWTIYGLRRNC